MLLENVGALLGQNKECRKVLNYILQVWKCERVPIEYYMPWFLHLTPGSKKKGLGCLLDYESAYQCWTSSKEPRARAPYIRSDSHIVGRGFPTSCVPAPLQK